MARTPELARRFFDRFEPVHAVTYFAPEALRALEDVGYRGLGMSYFAARSAPLGVVPAPVVTALFYNFSPTQVARFVPAAWAVAPPADALRARLTGAAAALRRMGVDADQAEVAKAATLCAKAVADLGVDGRALFAANVALPWPDDPVEKLWQATTLLREHRGDGHIAALLAAGISGRQANVLHWAAGAVPLDFIRRSRAYDDTEWQLCVETLCARGLLTDPPNDKGALTTAGRDLKDDVEATTNRAALPALEALDDEEVDALFAALTPITRLVVAGGDVPAGTPMGLKRHELDGDRAHLS